ncbi:exodeoxyribonuclease III, partial [Streptomyces sp. SID10244]|nr:exodeoxyribonuclease III [Streptomyces sp. SID10244]
LRDIGSLWLAHDPAAQIVLAGDWNIIPTDDDVWDPAKFDGRTHVSEPERAALAAIRDAGFHDSARPYADAYTFWDYTQLRFPRDEGMRIDYLLCSPAFDDRVRGAFVDRNARKGKGASDHAPVVLEI